MKRSDNIETAIVLWGKGNKGKTRTLNLVIQKLLNDFRATLVDGIPSSDIKSDSRVVLKYHGKKIGVITHGDDKEILGKGFNSLPNDCDIYICASRTKGSSCEYITTRFSQCMILWEENWAVTEENAPVPFLEYLQNKANETQAIGIIEAIKCFADGKLN